MFLKNADRLSNATTAARLIFIVMCLYSIDNSELSILRSEQGLQRSQLGSASIAPDNLPLAGEMLRTRLSAPDRDVLGENLSKELAWTTLQSTLSAYAARLKLLDKQSEELDHRLQQRSQLTTWAMLVVVVAGVVLQSLKRMQDSRGRHRLIPVQPLHQS